MLNNLFHLEKALAFSDNSAQHLLILGESCSLFGGTCRFLIGICDTAQEQRACSCAFFCDTHLSCSPPCPQLFWERTAPVQPIFGSKGVESKCWNDLTGLWLGRGILDGTSNVVQSDGLLRSWPGSHGTGNWHFGITLGWTGSSWVWTLLVSQLSCLRETSVGKNPV